MDENFGTPEWKKYFEGKPPEEIERIKKGISSKHTAKKAVGIGLFIIILTSILAGVIMFGFAQHSAQLQGEIWDSTQMAKMKIDDVQEALRSHKFSHRQRAKKQREIELWEILIKVNEKDLGKEKNRIPCKVMRKLRLMPAFPKTQSKTLAIRAFLLSIKAVLGGNCRLASNKEVVFVKKGFYGGDMEYNAIFKGRIRNVSRKPQKNIYIVWALLDTTRRDLMEPIGMINRGENYRYEKIPVFKDTIDYLAPGAEADFCINTHLMDMGSADYDRVKSAIRDGRSHIAIYKERENCIHQSET